MNEKRKLPTDDEIRERMSEFYNTKLKPNIPKPDPKPPVKVIEKLPPDEATLLYNLYKKPFTNRSDMRAFTGFSSHDAIERILDILECKGLVKQEEHRVSKKGRPAVYAVLTQKAYDSLGYKPPVGKGGFEHRLYANLIADFYLEKGMQAKIEAPLQKGSPKTTDVLVKADKRIISVQVVLSVDGLFANLEDLNLGADEVIIVTRGKGDQDKVIKMVSGDPSLTPLLDRITFRTIDEFFA
jgi:hypothetical protein